MKVLLAGVLLCANAQAQVFHCPQQYPRETKALSNDTNAFVSPSRLSGGGVYWGELGGEGQMHGDRRFSKGGFDVRYGLPRDEKKWFVCQYGTGSITVWTEVGAKARECLVKQRGGRDAVTVEGECR